eukprot:172512-Rhodomonas_salina.1
MWRGLPPVDPTRNSVISPGLVHPKLSHVRLRDRELIGMVPPQLSTLVTEDGVGIVIPTNCAHLLKDGLAGKRLKADPTLGLCRLAGPAGETHFGMSAHLSRVDPTWTA